MYVHWAPRIQFNATHCYPRGFVLQYLIIQHVSRDPSHPAFRHLPALRAPQAVVTLARIRLQVVTGNLADFFCLADANNAIGYD
eukprot:3804943-Pyramimonas_sp.AAC.1